MSKINHEAKCTFVGFLKEQKIIHPELTFAEISKINGLQLGIALAMKAENESDLSRLWETYHELNWYKLRAEKVLKDIIKELEK